MSKWKKRLIIVLGTIVVIVGVAFIVFHDDSDLAEIEKKQDESIKVATSDDKFDALSDDIQEFEDSITVTQ
jgi:hypothetical protein